jgi:hypothetical protein
MRRDSHRAAVPLHDLLAGHCGAFVRVSDLVTITCLSRQTMQREIDLGRLRAEQFTPKGCWWVSREEAVAWLQRFGITHAEAC